MTEPEVVGDKIEQISISQRKLEANRENSKRSTGPRTERGKKHARRNSLKHGLLASVLLPGGRSGPEDAAACEKFMRNLRRDRNPVGEAEESLVQLVGVCLWKCRRATHCEAEMIRRESVPETTDAPGGKVLGMWRNRPPAGS